MSKNYFNVNDNYCKNCDNITKTKILKAKRKYKPKANSPFMKAQIQRQKWLAKHGSGMPSIDRVYNPDYKQALLAELKATR